MAMTVVDYIERSIADLDTTLMQDVKPLTPSQLAWKPMPGANPIGFLFWHFMRSQDEIVARLAGKQSVWLAEKWYEKLGLTPKDSGGGYKEPEVDRAAAMPLQIIMEYAERVAQTTHDYMKSITDADLERALDPARPNRTVVVQLRSFVVAHGWWHLGEIKYLKGMQGMPFAY